MDLDHGVFRILEHKNSQDNRVEQWKSSEQLKLELQLPLCSKTLRGKEWVEETLQHQKHLQFLFLPHNNGPEDTVLGRS